MPFLCPSTFALQKKIGLSLFLFCNSCIKGFTQDTINGNSQLMEFRMYFYDNDIAEIGKYLEQGNDPNKCIGPYGWMDENPLWLALDNGEDNIKTIELLIFHGADVNLRPYIWHAIDYRILTPDDILWLENIIREDEDERQVSGTSEELILTKVEKLIIAGADVDAKGARNKLLFPSTDMVYRAYFEKEGSRPINHAIKNNLPLVVDLLLKYTKLDEDSLTAAKESGAPQMIEKINALWEARQSNGHRGQLIRKTRKNPMGIKIWRRHENLPRNSSIFRHADMVIP
jgi:hypothetical protein